MGSRARYGRDCHSYNTELHLSEGWGRRLLVLCVFVSNQKWFKVQHLLFLLANVVKSVPSIVALAIDRDFDCRVAVELLPQNFLSGNIVKKPNGGRSNLLSSCCKRRCRIIEQHFDHVNE